jgi:hypothetical protein
MGGGGTGSDLPSRVGRLEADVTAIKVSLATLEERSRTFATKEELASLRTEIIKGDSDLRVEMREGFAKVDARFGQMEGSVNARFVHMEVVLYRMMLAICGTIFTALIAAFFREEIRALLRIAPHP